MAYIGASGALTNQATASDVFNGNGSNTQFTLSRTIFNTRDVEVVVNNVQQNPFDGSYSVNGSTLTFSGAPSAGANNIYVNYKAGVIGVLSPTDNSVTANSIANSAVTAAKLHTTAVTDKLGYTPANKAGDTFTGAVTVSNTLSTTVLQVTGNSAHTGAATFSNTVTFASNGSVILPVGNTTQRPAGTGGHFRYNAEVGAPEYHNGTTWLSLGTLDGGTENRAAPSALYLKNTVGLTTSGVYWIKTSNMTTATQVYCDLTYDGGGWMLLSYGYLASTSDSSSNRALPNLNHDGTAWSYAPTSRATTNGLVASPGGQKSALLLAKSSTTMIMAGGGNPSTGGIDGYTYVYKFNMPNPANLTFANHSYYYNSSMTNSSGITVTGLKGDIGTWTRYTINEAIGASWGDSYPTGYGCVETTTPKNGTWDYGPFFPSIHSGSRNVAPSNPTVVSSSPDIGVNGYTAGAQSYAYRGWYGAGIGVNQTGQMSIWVR